MLHLITMYEKEIKDICLTKIFPKVLKNKVFNVKEEYEIMDAQSRVDLAVFTKERSYGFEIKGSSDSTTRLKSQVKNYDYIFDYNCVVIERKHLSNVLAILPIHWGIFIVSQDKVELYKKPELNKSVSKENVIRLIFKNYLKSMLVSSGITVEENSSLRKVRKLAKSFLNLNDIRRALFQVTK